MKIIYPDKLKNGDSIMVVCPSRSLSIIDRSIIKIAIKKFEALEIKIVFGKNTYKKDEFNSSSIQTKIEDIESAFKNPKIKAVIAGIGGYNCNQLLNYIDWDLIKKNPKIFCGFSDITILLNAIFKKTGLVTFLAPNFASFGQKLYFDFTLKNFIKLCFNSVPFNTDSSIFWSDDNWKLNQNNRIQIKNTGPYIINDGLAQGILLGGNLCSLNLLQGTKYFPNFKDAILCIEDDELALDSTLYEFERNLQSLIQQKNFKLKGLLIGRFQKRSKVNIFLLKKLIKNISILNNIPVIANLDFGHTDPKLTLPIGGTISIKALNNSFSFSIKQF